MSGNGNQVPLAPSQRGAGQYPRATTPHRAECYHTPGATGAAYMPSTAGGAQPAAPAPLRVPPTAQPPAGPPAPQQDLTKTTMAGHGYVSQQNQTAQARPQYSNMYRPAQHTTRPNTHPRQQLPYMTSAPVTATGPVIYPIMCPPIYPNQQSFQQTRTPSYYNPYMPAQYLNFSNPTNHTTSYYYANGQQLPTPNLQTPTPGNRSNSTNIGNSTTLAPPSATLSHPPAQTHIHQTMPGIRPMAPKRSHRLAIIDPETQQDILETYQNDSQYVHTDTRERQTPQPDAQSIVEEFTRMVNEVANQPTISESAMKSNFLAKKSELPLSSPPCSVQPQSNTINPISNIIAKSELLHINENKNPRTELVEPSETPIVSAISDSPDIVPKMPMNIKQIPKSETTVQPIVIESNKTVNSQPAKQQKQSKKPFEAEDKPPDNDSPVVSSSLPNNESSSPQSALASPTVVSSTPPVAPITPPVAPITAPVAPATITQAPLPTPAPQPQRTRESRVRVKSEEKHSIEHKSSYEKKNPSPSSKPNGPTVISSVDTLPEAINTLTSQISQESSRNKIVTNTESETSQESKTETAINSEETTVPVIIPSATERLSASIEKISKELPKVPETNLENIESSSANQAQAKLTQSIASCTRNNQPLPKMKDINLNNQTIDPDTENGNTTELTETVTEDVNKNEKVTKNSNTNNKQPSNKMISGLLSPNEESNENGKDEGDNITDVVQDNATEDDDSAIQDSSEQPAAPVPTVFVPKYRYSDEQWSPLNTSGKKIYDLGLLKQIKDDPLSKNKPSDSARLQNCNVIRTAPMLDPSPSPAMSRTNNNTWLPDFVNPSPFRSNVPTDTKKGGRNVALGNKGSAKMTPLPGSSSSHKQIIQISLRDDVKLNESKNAWKPNFFKKGEDLDKEEAKTQELYQKFRGILNKLTPQKFETLLDKVKTLEIDNQNRLEGVIDLVFEKAIDEPNFSEAYAAMCSKLSMMKVPANNPTTPDQCVNFRALIISKCQNQFVTDKVDEQVLKLEKELAECTDPTKKKELQLQLNEENRRVRMRSVGNVRFIGELYKLKMLTHKIMVYCMNYLIEKLEEEKLECLCKLLTTIGEQAENEGKEQVDAVFKKMQDIVDRSKTNKISSRVRFMIQDVIALRRRRWASKNVVDSQPKMMDQIKNEAEQQQRQIEIMNSSNSMGGGFRRDDGNRGKRDSRRQNQNQFMDNNWKTPRVSYTVDTAKFKAVTQNTKNVSNVKLAPQGLMWSQGSGTKTTGQAASSSISLSKNMYSALDNLINQPEPPFPKGNKDNSSYSKGASIERSSFPSRSESGNRPGSLGVGRSIPGSRSTSMAPVTPPPVIEPPAPVSSVPSLPQEPLPEDKKKFVKPMIDLCLINPDDEEMVAEVKERISPQYHAALVTEIVNIAIEKSPKEIGMIAKSMLYLVSTYTVSPDNFVLGMNEIFEYAPEFIIDIPMLYEHLAQLIAPHIEKKHVTFKQILGLSGSIISANQGHLLLKTMIRSLKDSMGPSFVKSKWEESGVQLKDWMDTEQVAKWVEDNKFEFLESGVNETKEIIKKLTPLETHSKLLQLMSSEESCDCIKGWVRDNLGKSSNEDWFMRSLIQAICEYALSGSEHSHFNQERMNKYSSLINEFGEDREAREASCLFGIQQLIHRLEHPQGLTLEIFQFLHEQYIISVDGFIAWEESELEPEGKGVMMKALTSFFTNIKEAENEDSGSED